MSISSCKPKFVEHSAIRLLTHLVQQPELAVFWGKTQIHKCHYLDIQIIRQCPLAVDIRFTVNAKLRKEEN